MGESKRIAIVLALGAASLVHACADLSGLSGTTDPADAASSNTDAPPDVQPDGGVAPDAPVAADGALDDAPSDASDSGLLDSPAEAGCTSTGYKQGTATAITVVGANQWGSPQKALAADGVSATTNVTPSDPLTDILIVKDFKLQIPSSAMIKGVQMKLTRAGQAGDVVDDEVTITGPGVGKSISRDESAKWPSVLTAKVYGGPADTWGLALTPAIVNAADFSVSIGAMYLASGNVGVLVDEIAVSVHYCVP